MPPYHRKTRMIHRLLITIMEPICLLCMIQLNLNSARHMCVMYSIWYVFYFFILHVCKHASARKTDGIETRVQNIHVHTTRVHDNMHYMSGKRMPNFVLVHLGMHTNSKPGLKVGHTCWPTSPVDPQNNSDVTYIWPACDPHVKVFLKVITCNMTWKIFDMKLCHRFLHSWQNTELVPCTKMKSLDTTCFKTACNGIISWFGFAPMIFHCIHQTRSLLTYQMPTLFSKEHVKSRLHPDNLVCRWYLLDPWPKWPRLFRLSDPISTLYSKPYITVRIFSCTKAWFPLWHKIKMPLKSFI